MLSAAASTLQQRGGARWACWRAYWRAAPLQPDQGALVELRKYEVQPAACGRNGMRGASDDERLATQQITQRTCTHLLGGRRQQ